MGSIITDTGENSLSKKCVAHKNQGKMSDMIIGQGTIEMIRKTPDNKIEQYSVQGNQLIDDDGVWCYQIPMNLDYVGTDEFGNIVPVQDSKHGIPTRTSVRFRFSKQETVNETSVEHTAKYLVPNIHELEPQIITPTIPSGNLYKKCYEFGSSTPNEYFRDLLWNKVYTVKNYIPRFENLSPKEKFTKFFNKNLIEKNYTGIRTVNGEHNNNIFPFNNARFNISFTYRIKCVVAELLIKLIGFYNKLISSILCWEMFKGIKILGIELPAVRPFEFLTKYIKCIGFEGSKFLEERSEIFYAPGCTGQCGSILNENENNLHVETDKENFIDAIQQSLAKEHTLVHLDFTNDWVNGTLYFPLFYWRKRLKKNYFFGLIKKKSVNTFCSCDKKFKNNTLTETFSANYKFDFSPIIENDGIDYHLNKNKRPMSFGVIKEFTNRDKLNLYYYAPGIPTISDYQSKEEPVGYDQLFATDIVLLGSFNGCDFDSLPRTFNELPATTANVPLITYLSEDETGDGIITGMDWGHGGYDENIKLNKGLLMDLTCTEISTHFKTGVNLSRLSELYVSYDRDMTMDDENEKNIIHDGIIGSDEIIDNEIRAKFASLNHNGLTTLRKNINTDYDTYKFHYIYPIYFDGRLDNIGLFPEDYQWNDVKDSNYLMFRFGEGKDGLYNKRHLKHFYQYDSTKKTYSFPLYNNSFYFYFGLNQGNTAIDKFNNLFYSPCFQQNKEPISLFITTYPQPWCNAKKDSASTENDTESVENNTASVEIDVRGANTPFHVELYFVTKKETLCFEDTFSTKNFIYLISNFPK